MNEKMKIKEILRKAGISQANLQSEVERDRLAEQIIESLALEKKTTFIDTIIDK